MQADYIVLPQKGRAVIAQEEISAAPLAPNEAVIRTEASMISAGTELSRVFEIKKGFSYPVRPGYCSCGIVLQKGEGLADIEVGQRVFFNAPHASVCRWSRGTRTQAPCIYPLPDGISAAEGTAANLALVALSGVNASDVKLGDTVAIFGLGSIGTITAALFRKLGARVIAVDPVAARCAEAQAFGASDIVSCPPDGQVEAVMRLTDGRGVDIAVDVTGSSAAILNEALCCGKYAQLVLLGSPRAALEADATPFLSAVHMKNIRVLGAFNELSPPEPAEGSRLSVRRNFEVFCRLVLSGELKVGRLISHVIAPEEVEAAYHGLMYDRAHYRCVVIDWSRRVGK